MRRPDLALPRRRPGGAGEPRTPPGRGRGCLGAEGRWSGGESGCGAMLGARLVLVATLAVFAAVYVAVWAASRRRARRSPGLPGPEAEQERHAPAPLLGGIGFVVNFF